LIEATGDRDLTLHFQVLLVLAFTHHSGSEGSNQDKPTLKGGNVIHAGFITEVPDGLEVKELSSNEFTKKDVHP